MSTIKEDNIIYGKVTEILEEADSLVGGERRIIYGAFDKNHDDIAKIWSVILKTPIRADQVTLCMAGVKIARASNPDSYSRDNYIDGAAYLSMTNALQMKKNGDL